MNGIGIVRAAAMLPLAAMAAGCSVPSKTPLPAIPSSSPDLDRSAATRQAVLDAYSAMWSDYEKDARTSNWQDPASAAHATGQALEVLDNTLAVNGHQGWVVKGSAALHPVVKKLEPTANPTSAEIIDCDDLSHFLKYVASTGELQDSTPGGWHLVDAGLVVKDGRWMVATLAMGQAGSC